MSKTISFFHLTLIFFSFLTSLPLSAKTLNEMTLEEKVGQIFMVYFEGKEVNDQAQRLLVDCKIGGIIYYNWANDLGDPLQVQKLSVQLQEIAKKHQGLPLFIAADQEGGRVARLRKGFTKFPGNAALGITQNPALAREASYITGLEMMAVGLNMNFAPVVDVNNNKENPIIGIRSFHGDPRVVTEFGKASLEGYLRSKIIPCLKHFPGHGDTRQDSHTHMPTVNKSISDLEKTELYPFRALEKEAPAIMTAHICFPAIDPDNNATLSKKILTGLLREQMGYEGLIISDSLTMAGAGYGLENTEEIFIKAFEAGNDILLIGGRSLNHKVEDESNLDEIIRLYKAVVEAFKNGRLSKERLDSSVTRILKLKNSLEFPKEKSAFELKKILNLESSQKLAQEIALRSLRSRPGKLESLEGKKVLVIAADLMKEDLLDSDLCRLNSQTKALFFKGFEPSQTDHNNLLKEAFEADVVVFCSYNAWKNRKQLALMKAIGQEKSLICVASCDPYDLDHYKSSNIAFATYSPLSPSLQVVADYLKSDIHALSLSFEKAKETAQKIWKNECNNRVDQLTFWNAKEPFPSMGIGHFIWPPKSYDGPFSYGRFHRVVAFIASKGKEVPPWLLQARYCPWESRESFYKDIDSEKMNQLRAFLVETIPYQAMYMLERLNQFYRDARLELSFEEQIVFSDRFFRVAKVSNGPYILIDYINFKHEGTNPKERYKGIGWGLLQVLLNMDEKKSQTDPQGAFIESAKDALLTRVKNSPNHEIEKTWIPNWMNRLESYRAD